MGCDRESEKSSGIPEWESFSITRQKIERLLDHYSHVTEEQRQAVAALAEGLMGSGDPGGFALTSPASGR
jgi:hypothetical protein